MTKEMTLIGGISLWVVILLVIVCFAMAAQPSAEQQVYALPLSDGPAEQTVRSQLPSAPRYLLCADGGALTVYPLDSAEPAMSFDIPAEKLRTADLLALTHGIEVEGSEALWRLIEDFSS